MRCPKCHYISFESVDRCRNCGYDLSLETSTPARDAELELNDRDEKPAAPVDLSLSQIEGLQESRSHQAPEAFDLDRIHAPAVTPVDLPLFHAGAPPVHAEPAPRAPERPAAAIPAAPLIRPGAPRPPIAVRRPTPDAKRLRSRYPVEELPRLDLGPPPEGFADEAPVARHAAPADAVAAPAGRRVLAGAIDALIVAGIDLGVLYFTLKLCALPLSAAGLAALPVVPLVGFLLLLDGGYAVTFTAVVGQTIGKMATGLRVVRADDDADDAGAQPNFGFAVLRTAAYAASLLPVGLGFLPALFGKDRRALHDRLAETRVIRVGPAN